MITDQEVPDSAIHLLDRMLCLDASKRINADEALNHEWFDEIRDERDVEMEML